MKKFLKITAIVLAAAVAILFLGAYTVFGPQLEAAGSVQKLEDGLYAMAYTGGYGFDAFLDQGGAASAEELADYLVSYLSHGFIRQESAPQPPAFGCSTMTVVSSQGSPLFGRNYDWTDCNAMLIHTVPENGYESVSTTCLDFLGFGADWTPDGDMMNRMMALAAIYIPMDGMNEKGLCVADLMAGDNAVTHQDTDKADLTTTTALRLLLDRAATVDEAVALLKRYDMNSDIGRAHHFALADATGRSVVVEYLDEKMVVTETSILTNHYLAEEKYGLGSESSHHRFDTLASLWETSNGSMTPDALRDAMKAVAQRNEGDFTQWTILCDTAQKSLHYYRSQRFDREYILTLGREEWLTCP